MCQCAGYSVGMTVPVKCSLNLLIVRVQCAQHIWQCGPNFVNEIIKCSNLCKVAKRCMHVLKPATFVQHINAKCKSKSTAYKLHISLVQRQTYLHHFFLARCSCDSPGHRHQPNAIQVNTHSTLCVRLL